MKSFFKVFITLLIAVIIAFVAGLFISKYIVLDKNIFKYKNVQGSEEKPYIDATDSQSMNGEQTRFVSTESYSHIFNLTKDGVVHIITEQEEAIDFFDTPFREFFEQIPSLPKTQKRQGSGSGFIIDDKWNIVTNNHVVDNATKIEVRIHNGEWYDAEIVGSDPLTDLAIIQILNISEEVDVKPLALGDSDSIYVGDKVFAIGNPLGLDWSFTAGVISAKGRGLGNTPYEAYIQTDASINPGNSGGPLLDNRGVVIGINTAIIRNSDGLGFAIPVNTLKDSVEDLLNDAAAHGWLGVMLQPLSDEIKEALGLDSEIEGVLVGSVIPDNPGDKAGLRDGDIIYQVDDTKINSSQMFINYIGNKKPNDKVKLYYYRDKKKGSTTATLSQRGINGELSEGGEEETPEETLDDSSAGASDIIVTDISSNNKKALNIRTGVVISRISNDNAINQGIREGFIVLSINNRPVRDAKHFYELYNSFKSGDAIVFQALIPSERKVYISFRK